MVGKAMTTEGERLAAKDDALVAREAARRAVHPVKFLAELRRKLGPDLDRRLKVEPNKTCSCGSCPVCHYRYAEGLLTAVVAVDAVYQHYRGNCTSIADGVLTLNLYDTVAELSRALNRVDY